MAYKIMVVDDEKMLTGLLSDHLRDISALCGKQRAGGIRAVGDRT